jgi:hypothetical protein
MQMKTTGNTTRVALWCVAVAFVIGLGVSTVYRSGPHDLFGVTWGSKVHRTDFTVYQEAGRAALNGGDIYNAPNPRGWLFMYLPVCAAAMAPFALLSVFWASLIWYLLSVAAVAHAVWISVKLARRFWPEHKIPDHWLCAIVFLLVLWPTMSGLARGQASLFISYFAIVSVWFYMQRKEWLAGLCLAGSIVLKVFPVLFLFYFIVKRRWLMAAATCVWLFVLVIAAPSAVFGIRGNYELLRQWVTTVAMPANNPDQAAQNARYKDMIDPRIAYNQSVQAATIRCLAGRNQASAVPSFEPVARYVALGINLCLCIATALACWRGTAEAEKRRTVLQLSCVAMVMLFLAPVAWVHNYSLFILPLALALAAAFSDGEHARRMRIGLGAFAAGTLLSTVPMLNTLGIFLVGAIVLWAMFLQIIE